MWNFDDKIGIAIALFCIMLGIYSLFQLGTTYTTGLVGLFKLVFGTYQDLIKITAYVSLITISIFFIIYSFFPSTVLKKQKNWTSFRRLVLSISSFITLGRGDIHVLNPYLQMIMALEGFIGFIFMIFIGARMVLVGKPILSPQEIAAQENISGDDKVLFNEMDTNNDGEISFTEFHDEFNRVRARQGIGKHKSEEEYRRQDKNIFDRIDSLDGDKDGKLHYPEFHKELKRERVFDLDLRDVAAEHLSASRESVHITPEPIVVKSRTTHHSNK